MAILRVGTKYDAQVTQTSKGNTWRTTYVVVCDTIEGTGYGGTLLTDSRLPMIGQPFNLNGTIDLGSVVSNKTPKQREDAPEVWEVDVTWSPPEEGSGGGEQDPNPLLRPPVVDWGSSNIERVIWGAYCLTTNTWEYPPKNSAFDNYDEPMKEEIPILTMNVVRNQAVWNPATILVAKNTTNSDMFLGVNPDYVKIADVTGADKWEGKYHFFEVRWQLLFNPESWLRSVPQVGYTAISYTGDTPDYNSIRCRYPIMRGGITNVSAPLDIWGRELKDTEPPAIKIYRVHRQNKFSTLGII